MDQFTDAACPRPDSVGRVTAWTFRFPDGPLRWDWSYGPPDTHALLPIRSPRSTEKSRHIPVQAYSSVTQSSLSLESGLEYDLLLELDRQPSMSWLVPQPARLTIEGEAKRRRRVHTPDLLAAEEDGSVTVWNVRGADRQNKKFLCNSQAASEACREVGWGYKVFAGHTRAKRYNLRWLAAYRRPMPWHPAAKIELVQICKRSSATMQDVFTSDRDSGHLISAMWHYAWLGDLVVDIDDRISKKSAITWTAGPKDG